MKITHRIVSDSKQRITAADNVFDDVGDAPGYASDAIDDAALGEQLDDIQDNLEDVQDAVEDIQEDDVDIELDNNINDHLIAECDNCKGIFISAMIASDQDVDSISGICPICNKETVQSLKWIVKKYPED